MPVRITRGNALDDTWALFHQTYQSVWKCAEVVSAKIGFPQQQFTVLRAMKDMSGTITPTAIANWLDRNPNSITLILDRMEKGGLVKRVRDLEDRREIRLLITPKGKRMYAHADKPAYDLSKEVLSALTEEELISLMELLYKVREKTFEMRNIKDKVMNVKIELPANPERALRPGEPSDKVTPAQVRHTVII